MSSRYKKYTDFSSANIHPFRFQNVAICKAQDERTVLFVAFVVGIPLPACSNVESLMGLLVESEDLDAGLDWSKDLVVTAAWWAGCDAKDKLGAEAPGLGDVPGFGDVLADARLEVLEVAAEAFDAEGGPG